MDTVTIICYGKEETMKRSDAIYFYTQGMIACEGSERERYCNILSDLMTGKTMCSDER